MNVSPRNEIVQPAHTTKDQNGNEGERERKETSVGMRTRGRVSAKESGGKGKVSEEGGVSWERKVGWVRKGKERRRTRTRPRRRNRERDETCERKNSSEWTLYLSSLTILFPILNFPSHTLPERVVLPRLAKNGHPSPSVLPSSGVVPEHRVGGEGLS